MKRNHLFPAGELLRYRQVVDLVPGEEYVVSVGTMENFTGLRYQDYALQAKTARDGLLALLFREEILRKKRSDRDLLWTVTEEKDGCIALYSESAGKYLVLDGRGARLCKNKQLLKAVPNGTTFRIVTAEAPYWNLRCTRREDTPYGYVFTSATAQTATSFCFAKRVQGLSERPEGRPLLTVGTVSDIHIDYGVQTKAPYLRKSVFRAANAFRKRYDLDAMITCGDNISDNASFRIYNRGVLQGKFPRKKFEQIQNLLQKTLQKSFRNPQAAQNIFWLSGNHDCQVGDRQPEGKRFNSNDYTHLLPKEIRNPLFKPAPMDAGVQEELLCYEMRVKGIPFLVLNTPLYPFAPSNPNVPDPHRPAPGHTLEQAEWLERRLLEIENELGRKAVIFVQSHYPFHRGCFISHNPLCKSNLDAYLKLDGTLNRYPNLFWFYGHVHGGDDWITHSRSSECMQTHAPVEMALDEGGSIVSPDSPDRGNFRSDLTVGKGFKSVFAGSLAYFETSYFKNDGVRLRSGLTDLEVPFAQGLAVQVYNDRVVLTMENFGTREGTARIKNGSYKIKPMIYPIEK